MACSKPFLSSPRTFDVHWRAAIEYDMEAEYKTFPICVRKIFHILFFSNDNNRTIRINLGRERLPQLIPINESSVVFVGDHFGHLIWYFKFPVVMKKIFRGGISVTLGAQNAEAIIYVIYIPL